MTQTKRDEAGGASDLEILIRELGAHSAVAGGPRAGSDFSVDAAYWSAKSESWLHDEEAVVRVELDHPGLGHHSQGEMPLLSVLMAPAAGYTIRSIRAARSDIPLWFAFAIQNVELESGERFTLVLKAHDFSAASSLVLSSPFKSKWLTDITTSKFGGARHAALKARGMDRDDKLSHLGLALAEVLTDPRAACGDDGGLPLRRHFWAAFDEDGLACMTFPMPSARSTSRLGLLRDRFLITAEGQEFGSGVNSPRSYRGIELVDSTIDPGADEEDIDPTQRQLAIGLVSKAGAAHSWPFDPPGCLRVEDSNAPKDDPRGLLADNLALVPAGKFVADLSRFVDGHLADPDCTQPDRTLMRNDAQTDPAVVRRIIKAARLSPREEEVVEVYLETGSFESAGARMGVAKGTTSTLYARAMKKLKRAGLDPDTVCLPQMPVMDEGSRLVSDFHESDLLSGQFRNLNEITKRGEEATA